MPYLSAEQIKQVFNDLPEANIVGRTGAPAGEPISASAVVVHPRACAARSTQTEHTTAPAGEASPPNRGNGSAPSGPECAQTSESQQRGGRRMGDTSIQINLCGDRVGMERSRNGGKPSRSEPRCAAIPLTENKAGTAEPTVQSSLCDARDGQVKQNINRKETHRST